MDVTDKSQNQTVGIGNLAYRERCGNQGVFLRAAISHALIWSLKETASFVGDRNGELNVLNVS